MQSIAWVALFRHIPIEQQARFMLVTASGTEIAIQSFLLIEQEFAAIKGRLAGTQDTGRVFFVPYEQIDYFGFQQPIKESEFTEMFNGLSIPSVSARPPSGPNNGVAAEPEPDTTVKPDSGQRSIIRSEVLERFRARPSQS
jgi:hypothetical protein